MEIANYLIENWGILSSVVSGVAAFFLARKKNKLDLDSQDVDIKMKHFEYLSTVVDDANRRQQEIIDRMDKENDILRQEYAEVSKQNVELKSSVCDLMDKVSKLSREIKKLENIIKEMDDAK